MFYAGSDELPQSAIDHIERTYANVKFIDIITAPGAPRGMNFRGYQIKVFAILLSSFK